MSDSRAASPMFERCPFVAVTTTDLARAREFWVRELGFSVVREDEHYFVIDAGGVKICFDTPDEDVHQTPGAGPVIGLKVAELQSVLAALAEHGIRPVREPVEDRHGRWAELRDPDSRAVILTDRDWSDTQLLGSLDTLLALIEDPGARKELQGLARQANRQMIAERGMDMEAQVLEVIRHLLASPDSRLSVKRITSWFADRHADECERKITPKWIGYLLRKKLRLQTRKNDGVFVIRVEEMPKLKRLFENCGVSQGTQRESEGDEDAFASQQIRDFRDH